MGWNSFVRNVLIFHEPTFSIVLFNFIPSSWASLLSQWILRRPYYSEVSCSNPVIAELFNGQDLLISYDQPQPWNINSILSGWKSLEIHKNQEFMEGWFEKCPLRLWPNLLLCMQDGTFVYVCYAHFIFIWILYKCKFFFKKNINQLCAF